MANKKKDSKKLVKIYQKAIFACAFEHQALEIAGKELNQLAALYLNVPEIQEIAKMPNLGNRQIKLAKFLLDQIICHRLIENFVNILAANYRLTLLPAIVSQFNEEFSNSKGEQLIKVTSAYALNKHELALIKEKLGMIFGHNLNLSLEQDKSLLGGFTIAHKHYLLDYSLANKIQRLKNLNLEQIGKV